MSFKKIDCNLTQKFSEYPDFGVLNGVKVFVSGTAIAGPFAGCLMAEMGAKVLQSEAPKISCGTRGTTSWSQNHRNEYSITCNPRTPAGKKIFKKCLEWADIWIESSKAGTYAKMGLTDEVCWGVNSKLCIVHVSGYGQTGPYKSKASYDVSGQAMGGYMYMNGVSPTDVPLKVNPYLSDYATAYNACICALSIMTNARITGEGDACDVSQYETMFRLLGSYPAEWFNKGYPAPGEPVKYRTGNVSDMAAGFSFYDCKDGGTIFIGMVGAGNTKKGYPLVGLPTPGDGTDPDFPEGMTGSLKSLPRGQRIEAAITKFCAERTVDEVEAIMNQAGIPNQKAFGPADIEKSAQYAARNDIATWTDSVYGEMKGIGITNRFKNNPSQIVASAPCFGEHNREVLQEFGYTDKEIDDLYKKGEIVTWTPADTARIRHLPDWGFFWDTERQCERIGMEWPLKDE